MFSRRARLWPALIALAFPLFGSAASAQVSVLTQDGDNARTGANTVETALTPAALASGHFGKLFTITGLDANVNGQALYVPNVTVGGAAHNVLVAYQSDNRDNSPCALTVWDADTGARLWRTPLPASATYTTAAPVIDATAGIVYVLSKTGNDNTGNTYLHAFSLITGQDKPGSPVQVQATVTGTGDGSVNGKVSFDGSASSGRFHANDRPGLLLLNGVVYAAFAHNSDSFPYHGWILGYAYDGARFTQKYVLCTTPNGGDGGVWMAGKGLTADSAGNIYCSVGNGTFDADTGGPDYGMCYLKLSPSLLVLDWFAPYDERTQSDQDLDLGNSGLVGLPGTTRLFGGATKFGTGFLLDSHSLGGFQRGPNGKDAALLRLDGLSGNDSVGQNPVAWDADNFKYVYLWANGSELEQFALDTATGTFNPAGVLKHTSGQTAGGSLAVSSNGADNAILWAVGGNALVRAFDATDVSRPELWDSEQNSSRDALGTVGHFQFPTVANGKVYVPTGSHSIVVYGLLSPVWPARAVSVGRTDGNARLLWDRSDGTTALWKVDPSGRILANVHYGPYPGWTAQTLATGPDGNTRVVWTNADGKASFWLMDGGNNYVTQQQYGPYPGWRPLSLAATPDNTLRALWLKTDGTATVWTLDATNHYTGQQQYGPYPGWAPRSLTISPDGTERLLWTRSDGRAAFWRLNPQNQLQSQQQYGPYTGYTAKSIAAAPDGSSRVVWVNSDGHIALWSIDAANVYTGQNQYGPYAGWAFESLSVGTDGDARLLWDNNSGESALWSLTPAGGFLRNDHFGPY